MFGIVLLASCGALFLQRKEGWRLVEHQDGVSRWLELEGSYFDQATDEQIAYKGGRAYLGGPLMSMRRGWRWLRDGDVFFLYLIWYPLGRFWVEMFRPDAWRMGSLATAQWFALGGMALGVAGLIINHLRPRRPEDAQGDARPLESSPSPEA